MAVPGIGLQSTVQFAPSTNGQRSSTNATKNTVSNAVNEENQSNSIINPAQEASTKGVLFTDVPQANNSTETTTSRRSLAEIESLRSRFQVQNESQKAQGQSGKAVQQFLDVADFQRKDELNQLVGIDLFV